MTPTRLKLLLITVPALAIMGCENNQPVEVFVPPSGDAENGKQVFVEYKCYNCHELPGVDLPERDFEPPMALSLGVRVHRVRSYGDLLTAIMYPGHAFSPKFEGALRAAGEDPAEAQMPDFTERMTVSEMIDLAEFLDNHYAESFGTRYQGKDPQPRGRLRSTNDE